jgi:DNA-binding response OmpR family regulator
MSKLPILLCEDDELMLAALEYRLKKLGYTVTHAKTHQEAANKIALLQPALIVVDLFMPNLTGLDFIAACRKNYPLLPIIAMSAHEEADNLLKALSLGANDVIFKPVNPAELMLRTRRLLLGI